MGQGGVVGGHLPYCGDDAGVMGGDVYDGEEAETAAEWEGCVSRVNRYSVEGVVRDVEAGRRVAFVASSRSCLVAFHEVLEALGPVDGLDVRKVSGDERIRHPSGGVFRPVRIGGEMRVSTADVVLFGEPVGHQAVTMAWPAVSGSPVGEVMLPC